MRKRSYVRLGEYLQDRSAAHPSHFRHVPVNVQNPTGDSKFHNRIDRAATPSLSLIVIVIDRSKRVRTSRGSIRIESSTRVDRGQLRPVANRLKQALRIDGDHIVLHVPVATGIEQPSELVWMEPEKYARVKVGKPTRNTHVRELRPEVGEVQRPLIANDNSTELWVRDQGRSRSARRKEAVHGFISQTRGIHDHLRG